MSASSTSDFSSSSLRMIIRGRVQGVGFRPFVYRLATELGLQGSVYNQADGVIIHIEGPENLCETFQTRIQQDAPEAATIKEIITEPDEKRLLTDFQIVPSKNKGEVVTEVCPDIAVCPECLKELYSNDRRSAYPFINCTNCGPRFTLIEDYPYDRRFTTMRTFEMCTACAGEYKDPADRRFHAQPVSCFDCGPHYSLHNGSEILTDFEKLLRKVSRQITSGKVVALKGLGGYNLVCDAFNESAVNEIRGFKKREQKPFAVMFRSIEAVKRTLEITKEEEEILLSWRRPIVILNGKLLGRPGDAITCGLNSLGAFLPYLPLHYLLFDTLRTDALVVTSGNESDSPILYRDEEALRTFRNISGGILTNNRDIARRADDSVVRVIDHKVQILRRARGYVPTPVDLKFSVEGILATGAELSNTFCLGRDKQAIFSQHIGDLKNSETLAFFEENVEKFSSIYRFGAKHIACDLHPDYLSTKYALDSGLPVTRVQHHHAHIAGVMAEYSIDEPVIGLAYDGTGYGTDGHTWGSEAMIADYDGFRRISHYEYIPLPGGDRVTHEPWRTGLSYLYAAFRKGWKELPLPFLDRIDRQRAKQVTEAIDKKINAPLSCSVGRLFDAVAAILNICLESSYHAQAPQLMENYLEEGLEESYTRSGSLQISFSPMIREITKDIMQHVPREHIVTKFHNTLAEVALSQVQLAQSRQTIRKVVLSGGSFQNKYLTEKLVHLLLQHNFEVFIPREVSCNDSGIALGQMAVAAHKI